ncbi:MAG: hypothetical protein MRZ79_02570 [Bacteroidia bacterium]|nr:hypothetical protein [Bacteroidia bacterium]
MAKKRSLSEIPDDQYKILGINTEEKIWKLSHVLNDVLGLQLQRVEKSAEKAKSPEKNDAFNLFNSSFKDFQNREAEFLYLDEQNIPNYTVILCPGAGRILPKPARPFRYFLFLHYTTTDFEEQEWISWKEKLKASPVVLTIFDLSNLQELKNILS